MIQEESGDYAQALVEVRKALDAEPSRELELYGVTLRAKAGDFEGAVDYLEAMLRKEPENDELYYNLGVVYGEHDRSDDAIRYMQRALEINPDNANALNYIGYTWAEHGVNLDEAERMIVRAIELRPEPVFIGSVYRGYQITAMGSLIGLAWAFIDGLIGGLIFAWLYNLLAAKGGKPTST